MKQEVRWTLLFIGLLALAALSCRTLLGGDDEQAAVVTESAVSSLDDQEAANAGEAGEPAASGEEPGSPTDAVDESSEAADQDRPELPQTLFLDASNNFNQPPSDESYRLSLDLQFESLDDAAESGVIIGSGARTFDPPATTFTFNVEGISDLGLEQSLTYTQIGDDSYVVVPGAGCITGFAADLDENPFAPLVDSRGLLGGVQSAQLEERNVEVNDVLADKYVFSESALDLLEPTMGGISEVEGQIFVSHEGHVVRIVVDGKGSSGLLGGGPSEEGQIHYELNFFDIGQPIEVQPPEGCESAGELEYPIVDDAYELGSFGGFVTYYTNNSFDDIVNFYRTEMAAEGWEITLETIAEPTASLVFEKDGRSVQLSIIADSASDAHIVAITEQ